MAKTPNPKKGTTGKARRPKASAAGSKKVMPAVGLKELSESERETYDAKPKAIDLALHRCVAHLRAFTTAEAQVTVRLLKAYYEWYGLPRYKSGKGTWFA